MTDEALPDNLDDWPDDAYTLFGIGRSAGMRDLRRAYANLIRRYKPEHHPDEFRRIRDAYEALEWQIRWREQNRDSDADSESAEESEEPLSGLGEETTSQTSNEQADEPQTSGRKEKAPLAGTTAAVDGVWRKALREGGDWHAVYRQHVEAAGRSAADEVIFCRLYWLLAVAPEVDEARRPVDWLAAGLAQSTAAPRLLTLYFEELKRRPEEVLEERSRNLLLMARPLWQRSELARRRWRALRAMHRFDEISADLSILRDPFFSHRDEWMHLLMSVAELVAWHDGSATGSKLLGACLSEINSASELHLALSGALDRHEYVLALAAEYRRCLEDRNREFPMALVRLLPELWLNSDAARLKLMTVLEAWVAHPESALDQLDLLVSESRMVAAFVTDVLASLAPHGDGDDAALAAARERSLERLVAGTDWSRYRETRYKIMHYCLHTGGQVEDILRVLLASPVYESFVNEDIASQLEKDLALKCLLAGHRAFWH